MYAQCWQCSDHTQRSWLFTHAAGPKMRKWYGQESGLPRDGGEPEPPRKQVRPLPWSLGGLQETCAAICLQQTLHRSTLARLLA
jgi:hypothetical protein